MVPNGAAPPQQRIAGAVETITVVVLPKSAGWVYAPFANIDGVVYIPPVK